MIMSNYVVVCALYFLGTSWTFTFALYVPYCPDERELPYGFVRYTLGDNFYSQKQLVDGVKKRFRCFRGYSLRGAASAECLDGKWTEPLPSCIPDGCKPIRLEPNNLESVIYDTDPMEDDNYASGTTTQVSCLEGMTLVYGEGIPSCTAGSWLPEIPLCLAIGEAGETGEPATEFDGSCQLPYIWSGEYDNEYEVSVVPEGSQVYYNCLYFAEAVTETPVTCYRGEWNPGNPECVEKGCAVPSITSGLRITNELNDYKVTHGIWLQFQCVSGYHMNEGGFSESKCWYGEWSSPPPVCAPDDQIDYQSCGRAGNTLQKFSGRVVGGYPSNPGAWPWQAGIFWQRADGTWFLFCAGSVVSEEWILSAGHCFAYDEDIARLQVRIGLTNQETDAGTDKEQIFFIDGLYLPTEHDFIDFDYDVALLHVSGRIAFNPYVRTVCLPPVPQPGDDADKLIKVDAHGMVVGWGHSSPIALNSSEGAIYEDNLQQLEIPIRARSTCIKSLKRIGEDVTQFTERLFCAGYNRKPRDTCFGDSGGPLMRKLPVPGASEPRWVQIGIVSAGNGCAVAGQYAFYTHLPLLMSWVDSVMHGNHTPSEHDMYLV